MPRLVAAASATSPWRCCRSRRGAGSAPGRLAGGGPAMSDAVAGHVDLLVGSTALSIPQIQVGTIRAVVQTGSARTPALGAVPTVAESGFPGFAANAWWGLFAPAGTPKAIGARFGAEVTACVREDRVAKQLTETQQVSQ